ncbi:MAG: YCF48-related protein [Actinomycetota bacterium]
MKRGLHHRALLLLATVVAMTVAATPAASEAAPTWVSHGPTGQPAVTATASGPTDQELYVGTEQGLYETDDGGAHWTELGYGGAVSNILVDTASPGTLYVTGAAGFERSRDGGASWTPLTFPDGSSCCWGDPALAPSKTGLLYAGALAPDGRRTLFKTTDGGDHWTDVTPPQVSRNDASQFQLAVDPTDPDAVYLGILDTVYATTNGGATWPVGGTGLDFDPAIDVLAVDPSAPNVVYAGGFRYDGTIVYRSDDRGATWTPASPQSGENAVNQFAISPDGTVIARAGYGGLWRSSDHGETWTAVADHLPGEDVAAIALGPGRTGTLSAALSPFGIFRSTDLGDSWAPIAEPYQLTIGIVNVAVDPSDADVAYAAAGTSGLFKTTDAGATWHLLYGAGGSLYVAVAPSDPRRIYSTSAAGWGPLVSSDGGAIWVKPKTTVRLDQIVIDPTNPDRAYGSSSYDSIWSTVDGGSTWTEMPSALPMSIADGEMPGSEFNEASLAISPTDPQTVLAALSWSVWRTMTPEQVWTPASPVGFDVQGERPYVPSYDYDALTFDAAGIVYAGTENGVHLSREGGLTWDDYPVGGYAGLAVRSIAVTRSGDAIYAGTADGVMEATLSSSLDHTWIYAWWAPPAPGLEGLSVRSLALSSDGGVVYAATGRGVYVLDRR